jgi:integral membrane protein (TIGR01906 family)
MIQLNIADFKWQNFQKSFGGHMRKISKFIIIIFLPIFVLLSAFDFVVFDISYFESKFIQNNTMEETGLNLDQLISVSQKTLDYLKDKRDDLTIYEELNGQEIQVFEERELHHMEDVKELFRIGFLIKNLTMVLVLVAGLFLLTKDKKTLYKSIKNGSLMFTAIIVFIGIYAYVDFERAFVIFHEILFDNDLWLLDPNEDIMIQMLPINFFMGIGVKTAFLFIVYLISSIIISTLLKYKE